MDVRSSLGVVVRTVVVAALVAAAGCGESAPEPVTAPGVEADEATRVPVTDPPRNPLREPLVGDVVPVGDGGSVAVAAVEADVNAGRLFGAGRGREYFAAEVEGCAGPDEHGLSFEPDYFFLLTADGEAHAPGLPIKRPELPSTPMPAGGCLRGWITFTVPDDAEVTTVVYNGSRRLDWKVPAGDPAA